jgi:phage gp29-like protein
MERIEQAIRQKYSPCPELTLENINSQLNAFRIGELRGAARTWEFMLERDGELFCNASKRFADVSRLPWEIMMDEESAEAEAHQDALTYFFNQLRATSVLEQDETGGLELLLRQMMTAQAHRYSVHEILMRIDDAGKKKVSAEFRHCPVWFFESRKGRLGFLREEFAIYGEPLKPGDWLTAVGAGLMRPISIAYIVKHYPLRDWLLYCSRFGIPSIHAETTAAKDSPEYKDFVTALENFVNNWIVVTNAGAKISLLEAKGSGTSLPFEPLVDRVDKLYSKLFRGSDLATGSQKDSVGASLQVSELNVFVQDDAVWACAAINERVVRPLIQYLFNTNSPKAWLKLLPPKPDTTDRDLKTAEFLRGSRVPIAINTVRERFGWPAPDDGEPVIESAAPDPAAGEEEDPLKKAVKDRMGLENSADQKAFAAAVAEDLQPFLQVVGERLDAVLQIPDPALRAAKWQTLWEETAPLREAIQADPASARQLEAVMAKGFKAGLQGKEPKK